MMLIRESRGLAREVEAGKAPHGPPWMADHAGSCGCRLEDELCGELELPRIQHRPRRPESRVRVKRYELLQGYETRLKARRENVHGRVGVVSNLDSRRCWWGSENW